MRLEGIRRKLKGSFSVDINDEDMISYISSNMTDDYDDLSHYFDRMMLNPSTALKYDEIRPLIQLEFGRLK